MPIRYSALTILGALGWILRAATAAYYTCQGDCVSSALISLFVCLLISRVTQKLPMKFEVDTVALYRVTTLLLRDLVTSAFDLLIVETRHASDAMFSLSVVLENPTTTSWNFMRASVCSRRTAITLRYLLRALLISVQSLG